MTEKQTCRQGGQQRCGKKLNTIYATWSATLPKISRRS